MITTFLDGSYVNDERFNVFEVLNDRIEDSYPHSRGLI